MASRPWVGPRHSLVGRRVGSRFDRRYPLRLIFLAVISPWVIRNWKVFHAFVPMRSNFGAELYEATIFSNDGFPWMATLPMAETAPEFRRYERLGEIAYSRQQGERAKAPSAPTRICLRRMLCAASTSSGSACPIRWTPASPPKPRAASTFVLQHLRLARPRRSRCVATSRRPGSSSGPSPSIRFIYYFVTVQARFRHPLEPIICVLAVYLFQSADRTRAWSWQKTSGDSQ